MQGDIAIAAGEPWPRKLIEFEATGYGILRVKPWFPTDRIGLVVAPETPLGRVFLGSRAVRVPDRETILYQIDRHGMGWADFDSDGDVDLFVADTGGDTLFAAEGASFDARNDRLDVVWPDGARSRLRSVSANQIIRIEQSPAGS